MGPDAAIAAFLEAADRGVDRSRASRRLDLVFRRSNEVNRPDAGPEFLEISMAALQNLSLEDKTRFVQRVESVRKSQYPDQLKLQALCYELLTLTGERNFSDMMTNLQRYIAGLPPTPDPSSPASSAGPPAAAASGERNEAVAEHGPGEEPAEPPQTR